MKKITDAEVKNKRVLVRVDFNVPMRGKKVADSERIKSSLRTIKWLSEKGAVVILCSHFGRPDKGPNKKYSLRLVLPTLIKILGKNVSFVPDCIGSKRNQIVETSKPGEILLLENVRFYPEEEKNTPEFSQKLSQKIDIYVNDAFSSSHRAHASVVGITKFIPSFAGLSLCDEVEALQKMLLKPKKPFVMVSGGAKISDKIDFLKSILKKIDVLILGGGMANTFLAAEGYEMGKSLFEEEFENVAEEIKNLAEDEGVEVILPDDVKTAKRINDWARAQNKEIEELTKSDIIVDIGNRSVAKFSEPLKFAGTIFWNGPVGIAEHNNFSSGTTGIAKIISASEAVSVIGGGDTLSSVSKLGLKFDLISTGGGATLEFFANGDLPGLKVLA